MRLFGTVTYERDGNDHTIRVGLSDDRSRWVALAVGDASLTARLTDLLAERPAQPWEGWTPLVMLSRVARAVDGTWEKAPDYEPPPIDPNVAY